MEREKCQTISSVEPSFLMISTLHPNPIVAIVAAMNAHGAAARLTIPPMIQISKDGETVLSLPVNIGIIGGIVGLAAAPWAFIAATIATLGFGCRIEIVKKDGSTDEIV